MWNHKKEYFYKWAEKAKAAISLEGQEYGLEREEAELFFNLIASIKCTKIEKKSLLEFLDKVVNIIDNYNDICEIHLREEVSSYITKEEFSQISELEKDSCCVVFTNQDIGIIDKWKKS